MKKSSVLINNRLEYIDFAKALGMFTIIWGHIIHYGWSNQIVYAFHIPLFFFMSGMVFKADKYNTVWEFIKERIKSLLVPYLVFSLVTWAMWVGMRVIANDSTNYWYPLIQTFIAQGSSGFLRHNLPLWFVSCLFVVEILYYFINKLPRIANIAICLICSIIGCYMENQGGDLWQNLPWSVDGALISVFFYGSGHWLMRYINSCETQRIINNNKSICFFVILLLTTILYFSSVFNGYVSIGSNRLGNNISLFFLNSYIGIAVLLLLCIILSDINPKSFLGQQIQSYIKWFGRNSFYVMATHFPIKEALGRFVDKLFHCSVHSDMKYAALVFIITLLIDSLVVLGCCYVKKYGTTEL